MAHARWSKIGTVPGYNRPTSVPTGCCFSLAQLLTYLQNAITAVPKGIQLEQSGGGQLRLYDRLTQRHIGIPDDDVQADSPFGLYLGVDVLLEERALYSNVVHVDFGNHS